MYGNITDLVDCGIITMGCGNSKVEEHAIRSNNNTHKHYVTEVVKSDKTDVPLTDISSSTPVKEENALVGISRHKAPPKIYHGDDIETIKRNLDNIIVYFDDECCSRLKTYYIFDTFEIDDEYCDYDDRSADITCLRDQCQYLRKNPHFQLCPYIGNDAVFEAPPWFDPRKARPYVTKYQPRPSGTDALPLRVPCMGGLSQAAADKYFKEIVAQNRQFRFDMQVRAVLVVNFSFKHDLRRVHSVGLLRNICTSLYYFLFVLGRWAATWTVFIMNYHLA